jgi:FKBP-type peptidyl-prolyl cis-trans isomerase (trigger factor)
VPAALTLLLGIWGVRPSGWTASAQSPPQAAANDEGITDAEIEQRARLLALSSNIGIQAKENFHRLVKSPQTEVRLRALQQEVIDSNPGKSREELRAMLKVRQKELGLALQKEAIEEAREALMPKLRKDAEKELIDERSKLKETTRAGIVVTDEEVKAMVERLAERNKMTYEQFAGHLKSLGVDMATMGEKYRAWKAWRLLVQRRAPTAPPPPRVL